MARKLSKQEKIEIYGYEETLEEMEERLFGGTEDDEIMDADEFACAACGNPDYPKCKYSCKLYDD